MADLLGLASLLPPQGEETRLRFEIGDCDNMDPINAHVEIRERAIQGDRLPSVDVSRNSPPAITTQ